jgi:hypothetical protein
VGARSEVAYPNGVPCVLCCGGCGYAIVAAGRSVGPLAQLRAVPRIGKFPCLSLSGGHLEHRHLLASYDVHGAAFALSDRLEAA